MGRSGQFFSFSTLNKQLHELYRTCHESFTIMHFDTLSFVNESIQDVFS